MCIFTSSFYLGILLRYLNTNKYTQKKCLIPMSNLYVIRSFNSRPTITYVGTIYYISGCDNTFYNSWKFTDKIMKVKLHYFLGDPENI